MDTDVASRPHTVRRRKVPKVGKTHYPYTAAGKKAAAKAKKKMKAKKKK
jgi:hypothetical protein